MSNQTQPTVDVAAPQTEAKAVTSTPNSMQELVNQYSDQIKALKAGDTAQGLVLSVGKNEVSIIVPGVGIGVIRGRELYDDKVYLQNLEPGAEVYATVIDPDNKDGDIEMSFRKAGHERVWRALREKLEGKDIVETRILDANKGGLMVELNGVLGFLPVSQLTTEHYPRVEDGDKDKILETLRTYIGQTFKVQIITADPKEEKLIVSEKAVIEPELTEKIDKLNIGDIVEGVVTGVVDFGAFVKFKKDEDLEGLVHISELAWQRIDDPRNIINVDDVVKVKVIAIEDGRISLSMKQLEADPWQDAVEKYKVGQTVKGKVVKLLPFGAFVQLDEEIQGLVHIGELAEAAPKNPADVLTMGEEREFKIIEIVPEEHRLGLSVKALEDTSDNQKQEEEETASPEKPAFSADKEDAEDAEESSEEAK